MQQIIPLNLLAKSDLYIDENYEGKRKGNADDDSSNDLLGVSNQEGSQGG